jgi:5-methylthioadenosine/S-adenosylhomocysteine deaminase
MSFQNSSLLIDSAMVLHKNRHGNMYFTSKSILIEKGKVKKIFETSEYNKSDWPNIEVRDASGLFIIPPFSNAHSHSYTGILKRTVDRLPLDLYMLEAIAYGKNRDPELIYDCTYLHGIELLRNGYQTTVDHFSERPYLTKEGVAAAVSAYEELGLRTVLAPMFSDLDYIHSLPFSEQNTVRNTPSVNINHYQELMRYLVERYQSHPNVTIALGVDGVQRCSDYLLEQTGQMKKELDIGWHSHLLESHTQWTFSDLQGESLLERMDKFQLLDDKTLFAHAIWTTKEDRELMRNRGVSIVHCACSNLHLGSGICPVHQYKEEQIPWFLGTDGFNCGSLNAFDLMRQSSRLSRIISEDRNDWLAPEEVFEKMINKSPLIKDEWDQPFLQEGQAASFLGLTYHNLSSNDFFLETVYYENGEHLTDIMQDGKWIKRQSEWIFSDDKEWKIRNRLEEKQLAYEKELKKARVSMPMVENKIAKSWEYVKKHWEESLPTVRSED